MQNRNWIQTNLICLEFGLTFQFDVSYIKTKFSHTCPIGFLNWYLKI